MLYELSRHKIAYAILVTLLITHVVLFYLAWPNHTVERFVIFSLAVSYFCWGVFAHVKTNRITKAIVREYLFVSLLGGMILLLLTL